MLTMGKFLRYRKRVSFNENYWDPRENPSEGNRLSNTSSLSTNSDLEMKTHFNILNVCNFHLYTDELNSAMTKGAFGAYVKSECHV